MKIYAIGFKVVVTLIAIVMLGILLSSTRPEDKINTWEDYAGLAATLIIFSYNIGSSIKDIKKYLHDSN